MKIIKRKECLRIFVYTLMYNLIFFLRRHSLLSDILYIYWEGHREHLLPINCITKSDKIKSDKPLKYKREIKLT